MVGGKRQKTPPHIAQFSLNCTFCLAFFTISESIYQKENK